jgi:hypothetical protein
MQPRSRGRIIRTCHGSEGARAEMVHIEGEIIIDRPVEAVFDFVSDERNEPRFNRQMPEGRSDIRGSADCLRRHPEGGPSVAWRPDLTSTGPAA